MKYSKKENSKITRQCATALALGEYAHSVIHDQYHAVIKQEKKVLADKDPEHLHHMRVGTRRLRTALQVFANAIELPKAAAAKQVGKLGKTLGNLRDLDVQLADLQTSYCPSLPSAEQKQLGSVIAALKKQRRQAFAEVEETLTRSRYQDLKTAYESWLECPCYKALAQSPLQPLLPDLLSPLLATLLLHPGWLAQATDDTKEAHRTLHELRKACKHVRYQAEFFAEFYDATFAAWIEEIKTIQSKLGKLQDSQVLTDLLVQHLSQPTKLPCLQSAIEQAQTEAMADWEAIRHKYLDSDFRYHLHRMLLTPNPLNRPDLANAANGSLELPVTSFSAQG